MQDKNIVELYLNRDQSAIKATRQKYERYLMTIAQNILSDSEDSRECVSDTYLAAWGSIPPNNPSVLSTYLAKITRRIAIDIFRKRNRIKRQQSEYDLSLDELADCISSDRTTESEFDLKLLVRLINDFVLTLSEAERHLFIGRYYFLDPLKKVADYTGVSEAKAKSMLYRIRCRLKAYLNEEGFEI